MSDESNETERCWVIERRELLQGLSSALVAAPLLELLGCGSDDSALAANDATGVAGADGAATAAGDAASGSSWATGGTAAMSGDYPDPFADGLGASCDLTCSMTLGPCYAETLTRQDISEGQPGLPVRLAFLVVDEECNPIEGASVDIWHTSAGGLYSGPDASAMCTLNDGAAVASRWFRGVQLTDGQGRANFDTCFPGWYSGRTIHIHFTVRINDTEYVTSQLFFEDSLTDDIIASQPIYKGRGARDTTNQNDGVIAADAVAPYTFVTQRMDDGSLLASKALVIRSATSDSSCAAPGGSGGPGGAGGPPPGAAGGVPAPPA